MVTVEHTLESLLSRGSLSQCLAPLQPAPSSYLALSNPAFPLLCLWNQALCACLGGFLATAAIAL